MSFDQQAYLAVRKKSGLYGRELAAIYRVSRQTIENWRTGRHLPDNDLVVSAANKTTRALAAAVEKGVLPHSLAVGTEERARRVAAMRDRISRLP